MARFLELLEQSVIAQAVLTVMTGGVVMYLYAVGREVPQELLNLLLLLLGIWTGGKIENVKYRAMGLFGYKRK